MGQILISDLTAMQKFAAGIAEREASQPRLLVLLDGPMGAGKTQFTRFIVEALGCRETCSPSFAIHHSYACARGAIEHFDLFRLESADDLESTGFWDLFRAREGVVIIEWAERLEEFGLSRQLPRTWPHLVLRFEIPEGAPFEQRLIHLKD